MKQRQAIRTEQTQTLERSRPGRVGELVRKIDVNPGKARRPGSVMNTAGLGTEMDMPWRVESV
jgi:hypothetical protein